MKSNFWTDERDAMLKQLCEERKTATAIGALLGCTKNAIVGRCRRRGYILCSRDHPELPARWTRSHEKKVHVFPKARRPKSLRNGKYTVLTLEPDQCRWPEGGYPYLFCGKPVYPHRSYCLDHCERSYQNFLK